MVPLNRSEYEDKVFGLSKDLILFLFNRVIFLSTLFVAEPILECIWFGLVQVKREDRN